ncbi:GNAT family N-acetyltransferase [Paenibacillus kandeliae]|uniref:GNAT family N-acetyltransferase n=1 Tax=Paenibacillus kandeliae TaxID=3231269 RepID=UPI003457FEEC
MSNRSSRDSQFHVTAQPVDTHTQPVPSQVEVDSQQLQSQLVYRQAVLDDAIELHQVIVDAYEPLRQLEIPFPAGYATVEIIENNIAAHECYVLLRDGQIAATVTLDRDDQPRLKALSDLPFIRWFAVAPRFKGQGDGARLLDWVEQQIILGKHHQPGVMLATASRHPWLAAMYERKGYRIFHDYVNQGEHIVYMAKQLNQEVDFKSLLHV